MRWDDDTCYRALVAKDARFDGLFFVGVTTTGIYCRPICPARTAARARVRFYRSAALAERAGYRACFRCRPELAPGAGAGDGVGPLVAAAVQRIERGELDERSIAALAESLGVSDRHLRRVMEAELGVTPVELAQSRRLALAKRLLHDTALDLGEVAFASGFGSVRRFNAAFRERFGMPPRALRRAHPSVTTAEVLTLRLDYRPPLAWSHLVAFVADRAIPGVEDVTEGVYRRTVRDADAPDDESGGTDAAGVVTVRAHPERAALRVDLPRALSGQLARVVRAVRGMFDLDAQPAAIDRHLARDPRLGRYVRALPGLRIPGAWGPFEASVRAVLGQQVSVQAARTLAGRLVARFGDPLPRPEGTLTHTFPSAARLAAAKAETLARVGMPLTRARALRGLARAVADGTLDLDSGSPASLDALGALPGIGPWTVQIVAMRALRWPDAFPAGDLAVRKALGVRAAEATHLAEVWRPWRAYAVQHLWESLRHDLLL